MVNFTEVFNNFTDWATQGYVTSMGYLFWPFFFSVIVAYVYIKQQSAVAATVVILVIFAVFGNALMGVDAWNSLMAIIVALVVTVLVIMFLTKLRR